MNAPHWTIVSLVNEILVVLASVELVDVDVVLGSAGEQVATIGESDLTAAFDSNGLEWLQAVLEDVHHSDAIGEADDDVEAGWVEGHAIGLIVEYLADFQLKWAWIGIVPYPNRLIDGTGSDKILLDAYVHALDGPGVEWEDCVLVSALVVGPVRRNGGLHDLIILTGEDNHVIGCRECDALDSARHDALHELRVLDLLSLSSG